jgi:hypothetical protein
MVLSDLRKSGFPSLKTALYIALVFAITASNQAAAAQNQSQNQSQGSNTTVEALPPDGTTPQAKAWVKLRISVPQMKNRVDKFTFYPYSTKPPKVKIPLQPLPEEDKQIKQMLISSGYLSRQSLTKPYPDIGWRWHYAYRNAQKRAGGDEPRFVGGLYRWADNMIKYVKPEVERINKIEEARNARYIKAVEEFEDSHKDEEMEALRLGLDPTPVALQSANKGTAMEGLVSVKPGEWYVTGQHKTPGLTYYWQEKLKLNAGDKVTLVLNDANAMLVTGGW